MGSEDCCFSKFQRPSPLWDLVIECEDGELHTSKAIMGMWSPVLHDLLLTVEGVTRLPLHKKYTKQVLVLLKYLCPPYLKDVEGIKDAQVLLPLAHEYNISDLKDRAETTICESLNEWGRRKEMQSWAQNTTRKTEEIPIVNFEEILETAYRFEAPQLKATCEMFMTSCPSVKFALLAEEYRMDKVLDTCIIHIGNCIKDLLNPGLSTKELGLLSGNTLLRILGYIQKKAQVEIDLAKTESMQRKQKVETIKNRLAAMTFSTEEHKLLTKQNGNDWRNLSEIYGSSLNYLTEGAYVSKTLQRKIEGVIVSEGENPSTSPWGIL